MSTVFSPAFYIKYNRQIENCLRSYLAPSRMYHGVNHIMQMLTGFSRLEAESPMWPEIVRLAILYHDVIYDGSRPDNEIRSAFLAKVELEELITPAESEWIQETILYTRHRPEDQPEGGSQKMVLDLDLQGLAATWDIYSLNGAGIHWEYMRAGITPDQWNEGHKKFLESMLGRDYIYHTKSFRDTHESRARANLQRDYDRMLSS